MTGKKPKTTLLRGNLKPKLSQYESNAQQILEHSLTFSSVRALRALRIESEIKLFHKKGQMPTIKEVQARHTLTEEAAQKFLAAISRALRKRVSLPKTTKKAKTEKYTPTTPSPVSNNLPKQGRTALEIEKHQAHLAVILTDIRRRSETEIRTLGEQTTIQEGFIYLAIHPSFEGWVKAGMTIDYELRLSTYNTADPLSRFSMPSIKWVLDRKTAERELLLALAAIAYEMRGEWARIHLDAAIRIFETIN